MVVRLFVNSPLQAFIREASPPFDPLFKEMRERLWRGGQGDRLPNTPGAYPVIAWGLLYRLGKAKLEPKLVLYTLIKGYSYHNY